MRRRLALAGSASLVAGHALIHVTLPLADLVIHGTAAVLLLWSFRNA